MLKFFISIIIFSACDLHLPAKRPVSPRVIFDGKVITKEGIFTTDCVYGKNKSISDHAPVIYNNLGTWNIAGFVDHTVREEKETLRKFFTHKFRARVDGTLVDENDEEIFSGNYKSELSNKKINKYYADRLKNLAEQIKNIFTDFSLDILAVQEAPRFDQKDDDNNSVQKIFNDALGPELVFIPPDSDFKKLDAGIIIRKDSNYKPKFSDEYLRAQSYCDESQNRCVISLHTQLLNFSKTNEGYARLCQSLQDFAKYHEKKGFKHISILGDFNVSAQVLSRACAQWSKNMTLKSYEGPGQSCVDNQGNLAPENIDLLMEFNYEQE